MPLTDDSDLDRPVTLRMNDLGILLDYAYRGQAVHGATCHLPEHREEGCGMCDAFTRAEAALGDDAPAEAEHDWWSMTVTERFWRTTAAVGAWRRRHRLNRPVLDSADG